MSGGYHIAQFAYYLEKLQATRDGEGSLLDHAIILYGAGIGNSDRHYHHNLPALLAGGGTVAVKGGRHIQYRDEVPLANLHRTLLEKMGIPVEKHGDSTGEITELSEVSSATG